MRTPTDWRILCAEATVDEAVAAFRRAGHDAVTARAVLARDEGVAMPAGRHRVWIPAPDARAAELLVHVPGTGGRRPGALLVLHWSGGTADDVLPWFAPLGDRLGLVVLCPTATELPSASQGLDLAGLAGPRMRRPAWGTAGTGLAEAALRWARYRLGVDPDRCVVTGVSMGGIATWGMALRVPDLLAAAAPLNGAVSLWELFGPDRRARALLPNVLQLPLLVAHGGRDRQIPARLDESSVAALAALGHRDLEYLPVPDGQHALDTMAMRDGEPTARRLVDFLARRRRPPARDTVQVIATDQVPARRSWLRPLDLPPRGVAWCRAARRPGRVEAQTDGCGALEICVGERVEPGTPLQVVVNGRPRATVRAAPDLATLVRTYRRDADPRTTTCQLLHVPADPAGTPTRQQESQEESQEEVARAVQE